RWKVVGVAEGERNRVVGRESLERLAGAQAVERRVPRVVLLRVVVDGAQVPLLARRSSPVVDQLVPGDTDDPRDAHGRWVVALDRLDGGKERLGRQVLG